MAKPASVEAYLAPFPDDRRARLDDLRRTITAAAPASVELISYGMPAYKLDGRMLVSFAAFAAHDSVFPASRVVVDALGDEVAPFVHGRSTFRFRADVPLPLDLIARIVAIRVDEVTTARA
jgi:uncharacterized protein YdhG (YjbR/CyaY superfamily)